MFIDIPHSYPYLGDESKKAIIDCIDSDFVGYDAILDNKIRNAFSSYLCFENIMTTTSASISLMLILKYLSFKEGSEVIMSGINCWSVFNIIKQEKLSPIVCDVRHKKDFRASYESIQKKISNRTKIIVITHMYGNMIEEEVLKKLKLNYPHINIVEDFSTSIFSHNNYQLGHFSDFAIASFGSTKPITGGIGGLLASHKKICNLNYAERMYDGEYPSYNLHISKLNQALLLSQISSLCKYKKMKKKIIKLYSNYINLYKDNTDDLFRAITFDSITELKKFMQSHNLDLDIRSSVQPNISKILNLKCNSNAFFFADYVSLPLNAKAYDIFLRKGILDE